MQTKIIENKSDTLITFLSGWGCDDNQFKFMKTGNYDILLCYDYSDFELDFDFSKYKKHYLITFSAGVFVAGIIKNKLPEFEKKIAVNGNPLSYDEYFGLRKEIINIFMGVTKENALDFRRKYLVFDEKEYRQFNATQSYRTFESCRKELASLVSQTKNAEIMQYDIAILSDNDKIFNPQHQQEYWTNKEYQHNCRVIKLENSAHFPFLRLNDYSKIVEL